MMPAIDHLGPMTRNVQDCALLLEVMAGIIDKKFNLINCRKIMFSDIESYII